MADFTIGGLSAEAVYDSVVKAGVNKYEASQLVGEWILANTGVQRRVFDFVTKLPASDPDCTATFARTFQHIDWVDGESVVQAGQTVGEDGFNLRMHRIEADLDALSGDVHQAFDCLAEVRAAIVQMLGEVKLELNRINADLQALARTRPDGTPTRTGIGKAKFTGTAVMQGRKMQLWETDAGVIAMPFVAGQPSPDPVVDPVRTRAPEVAELLAVRGDIARAFASGAPVAEIVQTFGDVRGPNGTTVADLLSTLAPSQRFDSPQAVVTVLTTHDAVVATASRSKDAVFASTFGTVEAITDPRSVSVADVSRLSTAQKSALIGAGLSTVSSLLDAGGSRVQRVLDESRVGAAPGTGAGLVASLQVATQLAGMG